MKAVILSLRGPTSYNVRGGSRDYIYHFSRALSVKAGIDVEIISASEEKKGITSNEKLDNVLITRIKKNILHIFNLNFLFRKKISKNTFNCENIVSYPMLTPLFCRLNMAIVHHLPGRSLFRSHGFVAGVIGVTLEYVFLPIVYRRVQFIAVSPFTKNQLIKRGIRESKIRIIPPGVDNYCSVFPQKSNTPQLFFIGRFNVNDQNKRVDHIIDAFLLLERKFPNLRLYIAGDVRLNSEYLEKIKNKSVELLGFISDEEKIELYQKSWVYVSPSLLEGFGMTWIEANACFTPSVAYEINGLNTIKNGISGFVVKKNDILSLAKAIERLIEDDNLRYEMSINSFHASREYLWDKVEKEFVDTVERGGE